MNAVFNIKRFGNLFQREVTYTWKTFLYIVTGLVVYFIAAKLLDSMWQFQLMHLLPIIGVALIICGAPFINKNLNNANFIPFLTTPASNFEKWFLIWAKSALIMPILIIGTILLLSYISPIQSADRLMSTDHIKEKLLALFTFQSVFFLGYIYFRERALVKSAIAIAVLFLLVYLVSKLIIKQFYPEIIGVRGSLDIFSILNFDGFYLRETGNYIETGTTIIYEICSWIIKLIFPFGLWALSYIKFREKEI